MPDDTALIAVTSSEPEPRDDLPTPRRYVRGDRGVDPAEAAGDVGGWIVVIGPGLRREGIGRSGSEGRQQGPIEDVGELGPNAQVGPFRDAE